MPLDRIYLVLYEIEKGTKRPMALFHKIDSILFIGPVEFQFLLNELAAAGYISFLDGNNLPKYGDIIMKGKGKDYLKNNEHLLASVADYDIIVWEYFLRRFMDTVIRYNFSEGTTIILNDYLKQGREKWENFKASFRKKKLSMNEIEKGNFYTDLKNDFYPIAKTYYEWYEKNTTNLANLKPEINAYTVLNEFCKDTINEIDTLRQVKTITGKKPQHDYLEEHRKRKMAEGEEKDKQAEKDRKKSFNTLISPTYDYSPTVQDFKEEMAVQKAKGTIKYLSFLRETKKIYINARNYYTIWGARGTGINRLDLYNSIVNLINPELEKEIELEKVRNNDPLADGILDLKGHIAWLDGNIANLEFAEDKLLFLNAQKERTQKYINNAIKSSAEHPALKIEGIRAERIKVARGFMDEIDRKVKEFKDKEESDKQPLYTKGDFCDGELVEKLTKDVETTKLIELCFDNFNWLITSMETFMNSGFGDDKSYYGGGFGSRANSYSNRLNAFQDLFQRADFFITVKDLCKRIESDLLKNFKETEYKEILYNIISIKIQDIENRLSNEAFITPYNRLKNEKIAFRKGYFEDMLYTPSFFLLVKSLTMYSDDSIKEGENRYGTLETLYTVTLDLFNEGKNSINNLFSLKKLNTPSSTTLPMQGNDMPAHTVQPGGNTAVIDTGKPLVIPKRFDYSNTNGYLLPDKIAAFEEIENELMKRNFLDANGKWVEDKIKLCAFIHLLHGKYLRSKLPKKNTWPSLLVYRRFFETRYDIIISKAFQKNQFQPGKAKDYIPDFKFVIPAKDLQ